MSLVRLQLHGTLDEAEDPEDEVNDVPAEFKKKMRQVSWWTIFVS